MKSNVFDLNNIHILIVDDQEDVRKGLKRLIEGLGCTTTLAESGEQALETINESVFDIVITDIKMDGITGIDLFQIIQDKWPEISVILITGYGTIDQAVSCLQNGASHFITKPFDNDEIVSFVERLAYRILTKKRDTIGQNRLKSQKIIAESENMKEVLRLVEQVAQSSISVLIEGESGTGKEVIAHALHEYSPSREKRFLAINCAALPDSLLESELFGYKRGAFTGAHEDSPGLFQKVGGGTIFLDEIASMSISFQSKLLRVLECKVVRPLGGQEDIPVKFRLVAATNRNLSEMVKKGEFREDLMYRLRVMKIELPTLNDRPKCIPVLAEYFLHRSAEALLNETKTPAMTKASYRVLVKHHWKGNVRELENIIKRALVLCGGDNIRPVHLGLSDVTDSPDEPIVPYEQGKQKAIEAFQSDYITRALEETGGNVSQAADLCGVTRAAFQRIMKKLDINREDMQTA